MVFEVLVIALKFPEFSVEGILLGLGRKVWGFNEELVVDVQFVSWQRVSLRRSRGTWGTANKSLYWLKNCIDYEGFELEADQHDQG